MLTPLRPSIFLIANSLVLISLCYIIPTVPGHTFETEPHPLDTFLDHILDFHEPTGIRGKLRYVEIDAQTVWLDWEERSDDRPLFSTSWKFVPGEATLAVHPTDTTQLEQLRILPKGTALEMIIKEDGKGHRHILSYRDMTIPPKVPL